MKTETNQPKFDKSFQSSRGVTWCGPFAVAFLTGRTYDEVDRSIQRRRRRDQKSLPAYRRSAIRKTTGTYKKDLERCITGLKFKSVREEAGSSRVTLNRLLDHLLPNRLYIVSLADHYVVVDSATGMFIDNQREDWQDIKTAKRFKTSIAYSFAAYPRRRARPTAKPEGE